MRMPCGLCEASALDAEDRTSINMDMLISSMWPHAEFEGLEKDYFCKHRYKRVADAEEQAMDSLSPKERQILVIILSVKDDICEALHVMGFSELQEAHLHQQPSANPTYEWRMRRFCDSGDQHATRLYVNWSMIEFERILEPIENRRLDVDGHTCRRETHSSPEGRSTRSVQATRPGNASHLLNSSRSSGSESPPTHVSFYV